MFLKHLLHPGNKILREIAKDVNVCSSEINDIVECLFEISEKKKMLGVSAPQIGLLIRLFVINVRKTELRPFIKEEVKMVFINPDIDWMSDEKTVEYEGCKSIDYGVNLYQIERSREIRVLYTNMHGDEMVYLESDIAARVIQHEYDHLNGILITDKIYDQATILSMDECLRRQAG